MGGAVVLVVRDLPRHIQEQINSFPESSYGANRVTVVLDDGTVYREVVVAWAREVVRVGKSEHIPFDPARVVEVRSEV
jgi:hypothetical protein